jgi:hypothetical protein
MVTDERVRSPRIDGVRRRLERWRETRVHPRSPIPPAIWAAAVALVRQHGLYRTARAVRVDYGALKQHVEAADEARPSPAFVELTPVTRRGAGDCVIEIDGPGARVRIRVSDLPLRELATLSRTLAGVEP